ncbi:MAG: hypothetical protein WBM70_02135 [Sulfurovum sp.]|uniref:hypothetical protein n=1 Tax=Sulfurovum sp. TaxID=1969726 RepID=UPI003C75D6D8
MNIKYTNIESELPNLQSILKDSLQKEVLDIKIVDDNCDKYHSECQNCPLLDKAKYVVFSPHVQKEYRSYEHFVFLDHSGETLCYKSGRDFELFGMLKPCINLELSDENVPQNGH